MLKSDLERLFRVEFFTIVFAIIVAVILLPFVPMLIGFALGAIVIIAVVGAGILIITQFPDLIICAIIFVVGFVIVGLVTGFFQNLKYSREQKIKEKKEAIYTKSFDNLSQDEKEKLKRQRNYLDEKEVKNLVEKNKIEREKKIISTQVGTGLNKAYLQTKEGIKRKEEEKIKKEKEEQQKTRELEKQRKEQQLLIINNVKEIQKEVEKSEKTHTFEGIYDYIKPVSSKMISFHYENDYSIIIHFYGRFPNMIIYFDLEESSLQVVTKEKDDGGSRPDFDQKFSSINELNKYVVNNVGRLWAEYKK